MTWLSSSSSSWGAMPVDIGRYASPSWHFPPALFVPWPSIYMLVSSLSCFSSNLSFLLLRLYFISQFLSLVSPRVRVFPWRAVPHFLSGAIVSRRKMLVIRLDISFHSLPSALTLACKLLGILGRPPAWALVNNGLLRCLEVVCVMTANDLDILSEE